MPCLAPFIRPREEMFRGVADGFAAVSPTWCWVWWTKLLGGDERIGWIEWRPEGCVEEGW